MSNTARERREDTEPKTITLISKLKLRSVASRARVLRRENGITFLIRGKGDD